MITATRVGDNGNAYSLRDVGVVSPDGGRFIIVVHQGDLVHNQVRSALLLFRTGDLLEGSTTRPDTVLVLASGSNEPAIADVRWLGNGKVLFRGGAGTGAPQLQEVDLHSRHLTRLTSARTAVKTFTASANGDVIAYSTDAAPDSELLKRTRATGFVVRPAQDLSNVVDGRWDIGYADTASQPPRFASLEQTFILNRRTGVVRRSPTLERCVNTFNPAVLSPDGTRATVFCPVVPMPARWTSYGDSAFHLFARQYSLGLTLVDLTSGHQRVLVDAPMGQFEQVTWAPDGRSLIIVNALLPNDDTSSAAARNRSRIGMAEVDAMTGAVTPIRFGDTLRDPEWDARTNTISAHTFGNKGTVTYQKRDGRWSPLREETAGSPVRRGSDPIQFRIAQEINTPPTIEATDPRTGRQLTVLDLNPQLRQFLLGQADTIKWLTSRGDTFPGEVLLPPDYVPGRRYPLVIQTHGYSYHAFELDGLYRTGKAAQVLAAHDIVVLQIGYPPNWSQRVEAYDEVLSEVAAVRGAIDTLDHRGLIDRTKVGVVGFSRGCWQVEYLITHPDPRYPIAAARVTDGVDYGYVQRVLWGSREFDEITGGPPSGATLAEWIKQAPGFNADRVETPLSVTALGNTSSVLSESEIFRSLQMLGKPVELTYVPGGEHILFKPWELRTSQQGSVDWFAFWLTGQEDDDPAKAEQYQRWRAFRASMHRSN